MVDETSLTVAALSQASPIISGSCEAGLMRTRVAGTVHQNSLRRAELDARCPGLMEAVIKQIINNPALSESA